MFLFIYLFIYLFILFENTNVSNYADDTTFYAFDADLHNFFLRLEHDSV